MDTNWTQASLSFPNFPRFCGQTFLEANDRELALLCVRAYNDWMVEEWCARERRAARPALHRAALGSAARGGRGRAQRGAGRARRVLLRDPRVPRPAEHPQRRVGSVLRRVRGDRHRAVPAHRLRVEDAVDVARRAARRPGHHRLRQLHELARRLAVLGQARAVPRPRSLLYAESQIGWIPYLLERADDVWKQHHAWVATGGEIDEPPSTYYYRQVYGCFFRDRHGMFVDRACGVDNVMFEVDYPHSDSTWPDSKCGRGRDHGRPRHPTWCTSSCAATRSSSTACTTFRTYRNRPDVLRRRPHTGGTNDAHQVGRRSGLDRVAGRRVREREEDRRRDDHRARPSPAARRRHRTSCKTTTLKATEVGVSPTTITVTVIADTGSPLAPRPVPGLGRRGEGVGAVHQRQRRARVPEGGGAGRRLEPDRRRRAQRAHHRVRRTRSRRSARPRCSSTT